MTSALVLGGGGVTGIAWELGVLLGLQDEGVELGDVDLVVGTSAGAAVGAQLRSDVPLSDLYARQLDEDHGELAAELDLDLLMEIFGTLGGRAPDAATLRRVGAMACQARTVAAADRRAVIERRLPSHEWPDAPLLVTAVDVDSGERVVLDGASGVALVDAVAASCAVPGVWPVVRAGGRRLMDGGVHSPTNVDLAATHEQVVVLQPIAGPTPRWMDDEVDHLAAVVPRVAVVRSDDAAAEAFGPNPLDPARRPAAAEAGRRQGRAAAPAVAPVVAQR